MGSVSDLKSFISAFANIGSYEAKRIQDREALIHDLEYLSGYHLETLKDMFAAGWTLTPPKYEEGSINSLIDEWKAQLKGE